MPVIRTGDGAIIATEVELADTFFRQLRGLMFRRDVPEGYAMLFDFYYERPVSFHMMFVRFPLDMLFLDEERRIIGLRRGLRPWTGHASSRRPARYAIELPAGTAGRLALREGDELAW